MHKILQVLKIWLLKHGLQDYAYAGACSKNFYTIPFHQVNGIHQILSDKLSTATGCSPLIGTSQVNSNVIITS